MRKQRLTLLILSFLFTLAMWIAMAQTSTPYTERVFTGVKIQIRGLSNNKLVLSDIPEVNIKVRGPEDIISTMPKPVAWVRIPEGIIGDVVLNINVDLPSNVTLLDLNPSSVALRIDTIISKQVDIHIRTPEKIDITEQFEVLPPKITIKGPKSIINNIVEAVIVVPSNYPDTLRISASNINLIDATGKVKDHNLITIEPSEIKISRFTTQQDYAQIPIVPVVKGYVEGDYILQGIEVKPLFAVIKTATDNIPIKVIRTHAIHLNGTYPSTVTISLDDTPLKGWASIIYPSSGKVTIVFKWKKTKIYKIKTTVGGAPWIVMIRCPEDVEPPPDVVDDRGKVLSDRIPASCIVIYSGVY